ncbi:flagellar hook-associated protein 1 [Geomonas limicola]|uniref:Flagellar hook-associated protein 1 n=1 Tax=Geomonas limicola TaxID=2740186 RepID=A0A6V8NE86_9BACT|nr:flagellar hook-associated protein FlgK [Geomonas limicola]GFO70866.1 flagellar hook-associated protein 1 [Geomonas limicola]
MGISNLFDVANSALTAQRLAIEVAGENIANVNTEGYSRQQVVMANKPVTTSNGFPLGSGVQIQAIQRSYDGMLQQQLINGNATYQQNLTKQTALDQIEPSFNELATDGLGASLDSFFGSFQDLSTNPQGAAERQAVLTKSQDLIDTFHQMNQSLSNVVSTSNNNLVGITADVSSLAKNLADLNGQIVSTGAVAGNANELLDQRDLLIRKLSEKVGITSTIQSDGTASIAVPGGQQLVSGTKYASLYTKASGTPSSNSILISALGNPPYQVAASDTNVTGSIGGINNALGQIGGTLQVRDTIVPGYINKLDELAGQLVSSVNTQHAAGYGIDGPPATTGHNFFSATGTTAATIGLDSTLTASTIAAGFPTATDPAPTSAGNNQNALKLANLQKANYSFSTGQATMAGFYNTLVSTVGLDTQSATSSTTQGAAFLKQLTTLRESNSGVSLDEELVNLTKYQQSFQGAAKALNTATEMLDTVLGLIR